MRFINKKGILVMCCFMFFGVSNIVNAKTITIKECEYTKEYINWLKLSDKEKENTYIPTMCEDSISDKFTLVKGISGVSVNDSKFSLVDNNLSTSVKNQGSTTACWSFATCASIESNLLMNNLGTYDLSEGHLELATQSTFDYGRTTFNRDKFAGGNYLIASAYLMNGWGPVKEEYLPFTKYESISYNNDSIDSSVIVNNNQTLDVNSIVFMGNSGSCSDDTIKDVKEYLITNGAITSMIYSRYADDGGLNEYYYYDGLEYTDIAGDNTSTNQSVNHAITIVGWDDNVSKESFSDLGTPSRNGAWIIKNSYGEKMEYLSLSELKKDLYDAQQDTFNSYNINSAEDVPNDYVKTFLENALKMDDNQIIIEDDTIYLTVGNDGYQYVSYDDVHICNGLTGFFDVDTEVEDSAYYHDYLGANSSFTINKKVDTVYFVSVFDKKSKKNEEIKEVAMYFTAPGQKYEIYYANADSKDFNNATKIAEGTSEFVGYNTIKINNEAIVTNDKYSILIKLTKSSGEEVVSFGASSKTSSEVYNNIIITKNVNFFSLDGIDYADTAENSSFNLTIRAYTNTIDEKVDIKEEIPKEDEKINTDADIKIEQNEYNSNNDNNNQENQIAGSSEGTDEVIENPQTGWYFPITIILFISIISYVLNKKTKKNKIFKL